MENKVSVEETKSNSTKFLEAAKDFSFDQKISVIQSILAGIPREEQPPWNTTQKLSSKPDHSQFLVSPTGPVPALDPPQDEENRGNMHEEDIFDTKHQQAAGVSYQQPPLIDPYEKSMKYYEKHLVLNRFQHMTAKLVLERPQNTLQFMIDWCKEMQIQQADEQLKAKTLYEQNMIDVYSDTDETADATREPATSMQSYGNRALIKSANGRETPMETTQDTRAGKNGESLREMSDSGLGRATESTFSQRQETAGNEVTMSDDEVSVSEASELSGA